MPLLAVHLYAPPYCLPVTGKGKLTALLSEGLVQAMVGAGLPSAVQFRFNISPLFTVCVLEICVISGGSKKIETTRVKKKIIIKNNNYVQSPVNKVTHVTSKTAVRQSVTVYSLSLPTVYIRIQSCILVVLDWLTDWPTLY